MTPEERQKVRAMASLEGWTILAALAMGEIEALTKQLIEKNDEDARGKIKGIRWFLNKVVKITEYAKEETG